MLNKNKKLITLFSVFLFLLIFSLGTVSAGVNTDTKNISKLDPKTSLKDFKIDFNKINENKNIKINKVNKINIKNKDSKNIGLCISDKLRKNYVETGCSAVVIQVNKTNFAYGFRRDSTYPASMYIKKVNISGLSGVKEYKTVNGYFTHTLILNGGWFISLGGADIPSINKQLENLGVSMASKGINKKDISKAYNAVRRLGIGHFVIKSPEGRVAAISYFGSIRSYNFKLKNKEYAVITNSPHFFKRGSVSAKKPASSAISLLAKDKFGVNRRNIIAYNVTINNKKQTKVQIYAANDNGRYVGRNTGRLTDNIFVRSKKISGSSLPIVPKGVYLGLMTLK